MHGAPSRCTRVNLQTEQKLVHTTTQRDGGRGNSLVAMQVKEVDIALVVRCYKSVSSDVKGSMKKANVVALDRQRAASAVGDGQKAPVGGQKQGMRVWSER